MRSRRFALLSSLAAVALVACEGNPPTRTGQTTLDFGTLEPSPFGGQPQVVWRVSKYAGSPFFHWDFRDWELKGNPVQGVNGILDLPNYSLGDPRKLFMRYTSTNAFWFRAGSTGAEIWDQHEVDLFARDPEEHFRALFYFPGAADYNSGSFDGAWNAATTAIPSEVPYVPYLLYPGAPNVPTAKPAGPTPVVVELARGAFFDSTSTMLSETVKAAKVVKRGLCSKFWDYSDLLPKIDDAAFRAMTLHDIERWTNFEKNAPCVGVRRKYANLASFVQLTTEREDAQFGGFFFNANTDIFSPSQSTAAFHNAYWFRLVDGRLSVEPQRIAASGNDDDERMIEQDFMTQTMESRLNGLLNLGKSVAEVVWTIADDAQVYTTNKTCNSLGPYIGEVPASDPPSQACGGFVKDVLDGTVNAASQLGAGLAFSSADIEELKATILETEYSTAIKAQAYKNFRCAQRVINNKIVPICEYILRAKRINVFPSGVSLVYVDDHRELGNPAYALWLQLWAQHGANTPKNQDPLAVLCDPPEEQPTGQLFTRSYLNVRGDCTEYTCAGPYGPINNPHCNCADLQIKKCK